VQRARVKEEATMPQYVFFCQDCNKEFTLILHIADLEKGGVVCPHCGGKRVTQEVATFSAVTSRKS
jgi:putative FmdB family regulatory protein